MTDEDDHALAGRLATEAGELLVELRADAFAAGAHPWQVMDDGDMRSHHFLVQALHDARPDDAILSEEGRDPSNRLTANRVWIVDPLDGTNEFGEAGRPDWAVHVALVIDGHPAAAAVALPAVGVTFRTPPGAGGPTPGRPAAPHRHQPLPLSPGRRHRRAGAGSRTSCDWARPAPRPWPWSWVRPTSTPMHGGMYEWDSAAPAAVAAAAGLHVSRIDGSPLVYNNPDPWLPDLLVCRAELAEPVLHALWS